MLLSQMNRLLVLACFALIAAMLLMPVRAAQAIECCTITGHVHNSPEREMWVCIYEGEQYVCFGDCYGRRYSIGCYIQPCTGCDDEITVWVWEGHCHPDPYTVQCDPDTPGNDCSPSSWEPLKYWCNIFCPVCKIVPERAQKSDIVVQ